MVVDLIKIGRRIGIEALMIANIDGYSWSLMTNIVAG